MKMLILARGPFDRLIALLVGYAVIVWNNVTGRSNFLLARLLHLAAAALLLCGLGEAVRLGPLASLLMGGLYGFMWEQCWAWGRRIEREFRAGQDGGVVAVRVDVMLVVRICWSRQSLLLGGAVLFLAHWWFLAVGTTYLALAQYVLLCVCPPGTSAWSRAWTWLKDHRPSLVPARKLAPA